MSQFLFFSLQKGAPAPQVPPFDAPVPEYSKQIVDLLQSKPDFEEVNKNFNWDSQGVYQVSSL